MELWPKQNEEAAREAAGHIRDGSYVRGAFVLATFMDVHEVLKTFANGVLHPVSEIPGRSNFEHTLLRMLKSEEACQGVGVSMFDVTGFKKINDTLGFKNGDRTLLTVAKSFYDNQGVDRRKRFITMPDPRERRAVLGLKRRDEADAPRTDAWHLAGDEYTGLLRGVVNKQDLNQKTTDMILGVLRGPTLQALVTDMLEAPMLRDGNFSHEQERVIQLGLRAGNVLLSEAYDRGANPFERLEYIMDAWDPKTHKVVQIEGTYGTRGLLSLKRTFPDCADLDLEA